MSIPTNLVEREMSKFIESTTVANKTGIVVCNPDGTNVGASVTVTADTEFPAAAALTDNFANPTTTTVGAMAMVFDGSTWDRAPGTAINGQFTQGSSAHDAVLSTNNPNPLIAGGRAADPTSLPTAVAAGDATFAGYSLQQEALVYLSRLIAGEAQSDNALMMINKAIATSTGAPTEISSTALAASLVVKATSGRLYGFEVFIDSTAATATYYVQVFNTASLPADATATSAAKYHPVPVNHVNGTRSVVAVDFAIAPFYDTGITLVLSSTQFTKTITGAIGNFYAMFQ